MRTAILLILLPCLAAAVLALAAEAEDAPVKPLDTNAVDLPWRTVNDNVMGGRSRGGATKLDGRLLFAGSTNTNGGGFSSIRAELDRPLDLSGAEGIEMRVKGDGRTYTLMVRSTARYRRSLIWYRADVRTQAGTWTDVRVAWADLEPRWRGRALRGPALDVERITGLGLMIYDKRDGPFRLEVERISTFATPTKPAAFSLDDLQWKRRPLVVFAPDADDPRLVRQLAAVKADREGFDERDMALVVILGTGPSTADGRAIDEAAVRGLRERQGVSPRAFAVHLVGKDGGTKRRVETPVEMVELFGLIDRMPMRQSEMRRRDG